MTQKQDRKLVANDKEFESKNEHIFKFLEKELEEYSKFHLILQKFKFKEDYSYYSQKSFTLKVETPSDFKDVEGGEPILNFMNSNLFFTKNMVSTYYDQPNTKNIKYLFYINKDLFIMFNKSSNEEIFEIDDIIKFGHFNQTEQWQSNYGFNSQKSTFFKFNKIINKIDDFATSYRKTQTYNFIFLTILKDILKYDTQKYKPELIVDYNFSDIFDIKSNDVSDNEKFQFHIIENSFNDIKNSLTLSFAKIIFSESVSNYGANYNSFKTKNILVKRVSLDKFIDFVNNGNKIEYRPKNGTNKKQISILQKEMESQKKVIKAQIAEFEKSKKLAMKISDAVTSNIKQIKKIQEDIELLES